MRMSVRLCYSRDFGPCERKFTKCPPPKKTTVTHRVRIVQYNESKILKKSESRNYKTPRDIFLLCNCIVDPRSGDVARDKLNDREGNPFSTYTSRPLAAPFIAPLISLQPPDRFIIAVNNLTLLISHLLANFLYTTRSYYLCFNLLLVKTSRSIRLPLIFIERCLQLSGDNEQSHNKISSESVK